MLWSKEDYHLLYQRIKKHSLGASTSVLLLVAPDVDALCASTILTRLFQSDLISYSLHPLPHYDNIREMMKGMAIVIFINCGAMINLNEHLKNDENENNENENDDIGNKDQLILVWDSHRPIHLKNVHARNIIILEEENEDGISDGSDLEIEDAGSEDEESSESEEEGEEEVEDVPLKKQKRQEHDDDDDSLDGDDNQNDKENEHFEENDNVSDKDDKNLIDIDKNLISENEEENEEDNVSIIESEKMNSKSSKR